MEMYIPWLFPQVLTHYETKSQWGASEWSCGHNIMHGYSALTIWSYCLVTGCYGNAVYPPLVPWPAPSAVPTCLFGVQTPLMREEREREYCHLSYNAMVYNTHTHTHTTHAHMHTHTHTHAHPHTFWIYSSMDFLLSSPGVSLRCNKLANASRHVDSTCRQQSSPFQSHFKVLCQSSFHSEQHS